MDDKSIANFYNRLGNIEQNLLDASLVRDNKILFEDSGNIYRVRMPSQKEEFLAENARAKALTKYIQEPGFLLKNQLKKVLKEKQGVDVEEMQKQIQDLSDDRNDLFLALAPKYDESKERIADLENKIQEIMFQIKKISYEIAEYLSPCVENMAEQIYLETLASLCTEKQVKESSEEKWERVWISTEEFGTNDSDLTKKAVAYLTYLFINTRLA